MSLLLLFGGPGGPANHPLTGALDLSVTAAATNLTLDAPLSGDLSMSVVLTGSLESPHPLTGGLSVSVTATATRLVVGHPLTGGLTASLTMAGTLAEVTHPLTGSLTVGITVSATRIRVQQPAARTVTGWTVTAGSTSATGGTATAADVGGAVTGPGIPPGTTIVSVTP